MCLIAFDWRPDATGTDPLLVLVGNRDEYFTRPTDPLAWWPDAPDVIGGRDLLAGGSWLALGRDGRFATLTNYRAPLEKMPVAPSRGKLVGDYVAGAALAPLAYLHRIALDGASYNGFNLLVGDLVRRELAWYSNRSGQAPALLGAGLYGVSNALLDTPWPKVVAAKAGLSVLSAMPAMSAPSALTAMIDLLRDTSTPADADLPRTGLTLERERAVSAAFIDLPDYGTRSTTALRVHADGSAMIAELSDDDGSHRVERPGSSRSDYTFELGCAPLTTP